MTGSAGDVRREVAAGYVSDVSPDRLMLGGITGEGSKREQQDTPSVSLQLGEKAFGSSF